MWLKVAFTILSAVIQAQWLSVSFPELLGTGYTKIPRWRVRGSTIPS